MPDLLRWIGDYFASITSTPLFVFVAGVAVGLPLMHAMTGKRRKRLGPARVLAAYVVVLVVSLFAIWASGVVLYRADPEAHEVLGSKAFEDDASLLFLLSALAHSMPFAFAVSSFVYGMFGGLRGLALGLFGVLAAIALSGAYVIGLILAGCHGWSQCI